MKPPPGGGDPLKKHTSEVLMPRRARLRVLGSASLVAVAVALSLPRIPQAIMPTYHSFADSRRWLGIPNSLNVLSNIPFLVVGVLGLTFVLRARTSRAAGGFLDGRERWPYAVLFLGVALASFGSAYYHLSPSNARLMWDRLPMTLGFMGLLAGLLAEHVGVGVGFGLLLPLVSAGVGSVLYWNQSELQGRGDLRPYILVQFYPLLAIPLLMLLFPSTYTRRRDVLVALGLYGLAHVFELLDRPIFGLGRVMSGHTLKHLAAALSAYWILRMLKKRVPVETKC